MDKIFLSENDINYLLKWRDEHKDLVRLAPAPMKSIEIICKDSGYNIKCIRDDDYLKFGINHKGMSLGSDQLRLLPGGLWSKVKDKTKLPDKDGVQSVLTVYGSLMALMVYGNTTKQTDVEDLPPRNIVDKPTNNKKPTNARKPKKKQSITYILRSDKNGIYVASKGRHASPKGVFGVRGHYRHYKSGKVVWISEFQKGTGKKKNKTFKVGSKEIVNG